jgi:hypothetical protein
MSETVTLRIAGSMYYSQHDEDVFFGWLKFVPSVASVRGELDELLIEVDVAKLSPNQLQELLALFRRYNIDLSSLAHLESDVNRGWLRDESKWWHQLLFPPEHR